MRISKSFKTALFALVALTFNPWAALAATTVIKAGRLVDVEAGKVLTDQLIVVKDNKIESIGQALAIPKDVQVVDLSKETVLPGLIDCHTHITDENEGDPVSELQHTAAEKALAAVPHARHTLEAGFTSVRDVGTYRAFVDVALRDAINRGDIIGPRMFVVGAYVTITGGAGALTGYAPDVRIPFDLEFGKADGPWEVRRLIRELAHRQVDVIKTLATGAILTHGSNPSAEEFTPEEMAAAVDEAHKFGLKVACHAHSAQGIKNAVRAGVASIEHGTFLDEEGISLMKQHGTYLVADIYNDEWIQGDAKKHGIPQDFLDHDRDLGRIQRENFQRAVKAGVKMAFGTDAGVFPHGLNARQFVWMVKYGCTPMQAIQTATINAADLIGKADTIGSIKPGKLADIIAVKGDPLSDVQSLEKVDFVMKDGVVVKH